MNVTAHTARHGLAALLVAQLLGGCLDSSGNVDEFSEDDSNVTPAAPVVSLAVSPGTVDSGSMATLTWSATDADGCTASGAWTGARAASGAEATPALSETSEFVITCTGAGGSASASVTVTVNSQSNPPTLSFSASPSTVASGAAAELSWQAQNATTCTASGDWSGSRQVSGNESTGNLDSTRTYTLSCSGAGGDVSRSVTVTVMPPAPGAPTLTLSASSTTVDAGDDVTLDWMSENADSCTASGAWSGNKAVMGNETVGPLQQTSSYSLSCSGAGGSVSRTVTVTVQSGSGSGLGGTVDSSLINRSGENRVYVFSGSVTPDDVDGNGVEPLLTAVAEQDVGACTFGYDVPSLAPGDYTVAFTREAADDDPATDDAINFTGTRNLTVGATRATANFDPANVVRVGPTRPIRTVAEAADIAQDGDVVEIDAGLYPADVAVWYQDDLTLRGVGGYAHLRADGAYVQGKGIWVIAGNDVTVENIEFSEVTVPDQNGAGIRHDGWNLTVCNGYFHDSDEGILGGAGDVLIEYSEFAYNGYGDGFSHNMYILDAERFTLRYSYMHHARIGHNVKTRARENYILYNRIMDESSGTASYAVDIPNGGLSYVIGNLMQQGPNTDNYSLVNYGTEGLSGGRTHNLYLVNNTMVDDLGNGVFVQTASGSSLVRLVNNLFVGSGRILTGASGSLSGNLQTTAPELVDIDAFDYRLRANSPARDAGIAPGTGNGYDLAPVFQYLHRAGRELRPADGTIDVGALEYEP